LLLQFNRSPSLRVASGSLTLLADQASLPRVERHYIPLLFSPVASFTRAFFIAFSAGEWIPFTFTPYNHVCMILKTHKPPPHTKEA
jgi:hypothetical protein